MPEEDTRPDYTEVIKLGFETNKHLTTLNAGSIVIIGTFLSDIFPTDNQGALTVPGCIEVLVGLAFVGFGVSLISAILTLYSIRGHFNNYVQRMAVGEEHGGRPGAGASGIIVLVPFGLFTFGLICFGTAVLLNLFSGS
jgi:hypothetical protein